MTDRDALRASLRAKRAALGPDARRAAAEAVCAALLAWEGLEDPVFAYVSVGTELSTRPLLAALEAAGRPVLLPRITGPGSMEAARADALVPGPHGIPAPTGPVGVPRVVLVPGLGFDVRGGRLGQGGGYYDRWLAAHPGVRTVGLAFDAQILDEVPMEPWDRALDAVLTGSGWLLGP